MISLKDIPPKPGIYQFKDNKNIILYIGKAKNLRKRVSNYFQKKDHDEKTKELVKRIRKLDYIITGNEVEALVLENNLIKKHQPKYNIDLKDSKKYAYIRITDEDFPRLETARTKLKKGKYFGPFVSGSSRHYILKLLRKNFHIRTCRRMPKKPCLRFHIKMCKAPCTKNISKEDYNKNIESVELVLKGKTEEIIKKLKKQMKSHSKNLEFEKALELRNQIDAINWLSEKQNMERQKKYNEGIINFTIKDNKVYLMMFSIHKGILENKQEFEFDYNPFFLEEFIVQYYSENHVPKSIILPKKINDSIKKFLEERRKTKISLETPKIGEKKKLLELIKTNIDYSFFADTAALEDLKTKLRLNDLPRIIECFDISHISGTSTVASMVQFRNARPDKSNYRRYRIRTVKGIDDFRSIAEVVRRRYSRLKEENKEMPDLIVIDGGKGQLSAALDELRKLNIRIPLISLAKKLEEIFVPGRRLPISLDSKTQALKLLQRTRDEAHRFAITYNRLLRKKEQLNQDGK